jgi:hypothetical protein
MINRQREKGNNKISIAAAVVSLAVSNHPLLSFQDVLGHWVPLPSRQ